MGEWSELPGDLLDEIGKLLTYVDYIRFSCVCVSWKFLLQERPKLPVCEIPSLMLPFNKESETHCSLYNLLEEKSCLLELPQAFGKLYRGASNGWLVVIEDGQALQLLNPLTTVQIDLPPITTFPNVHGFSPDRHGEEYLIETHDTGCAREFYFDKNDVHNCFIGKVTVSPSHLSSNCNDYTAVAMYGFDRRLAFCKRGDTQWTPASTPIEGFIDAIFHEGKFYAIQGGGSILVGCEIDCLPNFERIPVQRAKFSSYGNFLYLVGTSDGLLMVERISKYWPLELPGYERGGSNYSTSKFRIFKLDTSKPRKRWSRVKSLGNGILFLGFNSPILVSSLDFPKLQGNCIYFMDDNEEGHKEGITGGFDVGCFNLETGRTSPLPGYNGDKILVWPPPIWVVPIPSSC